MWNKKVKDKQKNGNISQLSKFTFGTLEADGWNLRCQPTGGWLVVVKPGGLLKFASKLLDDDLSFLDLLIKSRKHTEVVVGVDVYVAKLLRLICSILPITMII